VELVISRKEDIVIWANLGFLAADLGSGTLRLSEDSSSGSKVTCLKLETCWSLAFSMRCFKPARLLKNKLCGALVLTSLVLYTAEKDLLGALTRVSWVFIVPYLGKLSILNMAPFILLT